MWSSLYVSLDKALQSLKLARVQGIPNPKCRSHALGLQRCFPQTISSHGHVNRDPIRPSRPLHPQPKCNNRWSYPQSQRLYRHLHHSQPRSIRKEISTVHAKNNEKAFSDNLKHRSAFADSSRQEVSAAGDQTVQGWAGSYKTGQGLG